MPSPILRRKIRSSETPKDEMKKKEMLRRRFFLDDKGRASSSIALLVHMHRCGDLPANGTAGEVVFAALAALRMRRPGTGVSRVRARLIISLADRPPFQGAHASCPRRGWAGRVLCLLGREVACGVRRNGMPASVIGSLSHLAFFFFFLGPLVACQLIAPANHGRVCI